MVGSKIIYVNKTNGEIFDSRGVFMFDGETFFDYGEKIQNSLATAKDVYCYGVDIEELEIPIKFAFSQNSDKWEETYRTEHNYQKKNKQDFIFSIPDEVSVIHASCFNGCDNLFGEIHLPNSLEVIEDKAFAYCSGLTGELIFPEKVNDIGDCAFRECTGITSIYIPKRVKKISEGAFCGCGGVAQITVDSQNKFYDSRDNCNAIIQTKRNKLIFGCENTFIPDGVTEISSRAFGKCKNLKKLTIPKSVVTIGGYNFSNCSNLEQISVDVENKVFDSRNNCNAIICTRSRKLLFGCKNTIIPDDVIEIGDSAFENSGLTQIVIPSSVKVIYEDAFADCKNLTYVEISDWLHIHDMAFEGCVNLTTIVCKATTPPICDEDVFADCDNLSEIFVPKESVEDYKRKKGWREFKNIIKPIKE